MDQKTRDYVSQRFNKLWETSHSLANRIDVLFIRHVNQGVSSEFSNSEDEYWKLVTNFSSLLNFLGSTDSYLKRLSEEVKSLEYSPRDVHKLFGLIAGLQEDFDLGLLEKLIERIEANISIDFLEQAQNLLNENPQIRFNYVPAAVLTGAILEKNIKVLCIRQSPPVQLLKANGENRSLEDLINELKKSLIYNEAKAKQIRSWTAIRNHAAHGEFDQFDKNDVEMMLQGVTNFIADYL